MTVDREIFFLINSLGGGGAEGVCVNLANGLHDRGWRVTLVVLHLNNAVRQKDLKEGVRLVVLGKNHARTAPIALANYLRKHKPKKILVFNHQLAVLLILLRAVLLFDFKIIARNINTLSQKKAVETSFWHKHIVQGVTKLLYGKVDRMIAQSRGMAEDLASFYGVAEKKITIIHNPVSAAIEGYSPPEQIYCRPGEGMSVELPRHARRKRWAYEHGPKAGDGIHHRNPQGSGCKRTIHIGLHGVGQDQIRPLTAEQAMEAGQEKSILHRIRPLPIHGDVEMGKPLGLKPPCVLVLWGDTADCIPSRSKRLHEREAESVQPTCGVIQDEDLLPGSPRAPLRPSGPGVLIRRGEGA